MTNKKKHPRRLGREAVLQALYAREISGEVKEKILNDILNRYSFDKKTSEFVTELFLKSIELRPWCEKQVVDVLENWDYARVALLDRLILQMAVCEIHFIEDVPEKVSITEAIEIAKTFSTEDSSSFINGILDAIFKKLNTSKE